VRGDGNEWVVTVDGRTRPVTVSEIDGRWSLLLGPPGGRHDDGSSAVPGTGPAWRSYEVSFESRDGGHVVHVDGDPVHVSIVEPRTRFGRRGGEAAAGGVVSGAVVAPMPGRIVKLLVQQGDAVAARQGVVIVEAMKMENELRAPRAGRVADVRVAEGMSVEGHAVLLVIE
jgi:biotin carboxyl carrier protein